MNNTYMKDENLLSLLSLNNMIVPEIQREYVWGKEENKAVLERFLNNIRDNCDVCNECKQVHKKKDINIGFLYSYKPSYVILNNERYLDEFLIDGQQRFTTLFLLLAYLAVKEDRSKDFLAIVRFDAGIEEINFDYKVRNLTHRFLIDFLNSFKEDTSTKDIIPIEKDKFFSISQTWFLSDYYSDVTIQAMLGALKTIAETFCDECYYFDYILSAVRFWHFKTEATSQGEELYITMNSRGEKLADNEQQKAQILSLPPDKLLEWGAKWEEWQDFFWKHKSSNPNADTGFNEFIRWIKIIDNLGNKSPTVDTVEKYFNAVEFLFVKSEIFKKNLSWLSPEKGENDQIVLFCLLPVIKYVERFGLKTEDRKIVRVKLFFKNLSRIDNVRKAVKDLLPETLEIIQGLPDDDIASMQQLGKVSIQILTQEERRKFDLYLNPNYQREKLEDAFWKSEEHNIWRGEILPMINWATQAGTFDFDLFGKYDDVFCKLFHDKLNYEGLDITRRALLTRNLYGYPRIFRGYTNYSFCWEYSDWKKLIHENETKFGEFLKEIMDNGIDYRQQMINGDTADEGFDEFAKIPELLEYCKEKNIQLDNVMNTWILVKSSRRGRSFGGYGHANLKSYCLHLDFNKNPFWDIDWKEKFYDEGRTCVSFDYEKKHIAIDVYYSGNDFYQLQVFRRGDNVEVQNYLFKAAAKFSLSWNEKRYNSSQIGKDDIIELLKQIMDNFGKN